MEVQTAVCSAICLLYMHGSFAAYSAGYLVAVEKSGATEFGEGSMAYVGCLWDHIVLNT